MNAKLFSALTAFLLIGFVTKTAYSDDAKPATTESHEQHHPDANAAAPKTDSNSMGDQGGMMGKMDMGQMHGMMHECMSMHKDGKMCDHQMMEKCEKQMPKGECQKMMKEAKVKMNEKTKKK